MRSTGRVDKLILIDMARGWERLALETEQARRQVPKLCCAINFDGSYRRRLGPHQG